MWTMLHSRGLVRDQALLAAMSAAVLLSCSNGLSRSRATDTEDVGPDDSDCGFPGPGDDGAVAGEATCSPNCHLRCCGPDGCGGTCPSNCRAGRKCNPGSCECEEVVERFLMVTREQTGGGSIIEGDTIGSTPTPWVKLKAEPGVAGQFAVSSDGKSIAFVDADPAGGPGWSLMVLDDKGGKPRFVAVVALEPVSEEMPGQPAWSPDSKELAFVRKDGTGWTIMVAEAGGGDAAAVFDLAPPHASATRCVGPRWAPVGRRIAFGGWCDAPAGPEGCLVVWDIDTGGQKTILSIPGGTICQPDWSHDGQRIAYAVYDSAFLAERLEMVETGPGGIPQYVTTVSGRSFGAGQARWSPDGARIAFVSHDFIVHEGAVFVLTPGQQCDDDHPCVLDRLFAEVMAGHPAWSPSGTTLAYTKWDHVQDRPIVAIINPLGGDPKPVYWLSGAVGSSGHPAWLPAD